MPLLELPLGIISNIKKNRCRIFPVYEGAQPTKAQLSSLFGSTGSRIRGYQLSSNAALPTIITIAVNCRCLFYFLMESNVCLQAIKPQEIQNTMIDELGICEQNELISKSLDTGYMQVLYAMSHVRINFQNTVEVSTAQQDRALELLH